jgi:lysophospholipase
LPLSRHFANFHLVKFFIPLAGGACRGLNCKIVDGLELHQQVTVSYFLSHSNLFSSFSFDPLVTLHNKDRVCYTRIGLEKFKMAAGRNGSGPGEKERHVLVIITGGTICMQDSPDGLIPTRDFVGNCLKPSPEFNDGSLHEDTAVTNEYGRNGIATTLRAPPRNSDSPTYKYSVFEFAELIDSSSMDGGHWNLILKCLKSNWNDFDAFVVLHGTDTLAYTASMLAFMLGALNKTVIVTGSQLSMYAPHNDAHDNLLDSLTVAALYDLPEVGVVFHHHLYRGTRVTKVSAFSMAAFTTPNAKPLASFQRHAGQAWAAHLHLDTIVPGSVANPSKKNGVSEAATAPVTNLDTSRVAVLKVYPGISSSLISSIIQIPNLGGLVLETFGAGNIPIVVGGKGLLQILSTAVRMGIVVVSVTQCTWSKLLVSIPNC